MPAEAKKLLEVMTTADIVKFVQDFGEDSDAAFDALLEKLVKKEITMEQVWEAIGEDSEAYPFEYPYRHPDEVICPTFLTVLSVELDRANGNPYANAC